MRDINRISKENIILGLEAKTKEEVIKKISQKLFENGYISDEKHFVEAVNYREAQISTGIGNGIAIPHGASKSVKESTVFFASLNEPVPWDSLDSLPVGYVFLLAITKKEHGDEHIRVLANLAKNLMDSDYVDSFKQAKNTDEIFEYLNKGEE